MKRFDHTLLFILSALGLVPPDICVDGVFCTDAECDGNSHPHLDGQAQTSTTTMIETTSVTQETTPSPFTYQHEPTFNPLLRRERDYPEFEMTAEESVNTQSLEFDVYANALSGDVSSRTDSEKSERIVLSSCPDSRILKARVNGKRANPWLWSIWGCAPRNITIEVHFHYVADGIYALPPSLTLQVNKLMNYFRSILAPYQIFFKYSGILNILIDGNFTNNKWDPNIRSSAMRRQTEFRRRTRVQGPEVLNVWIVDSITSVPSKPGEFMYGYSELPGYKLFDYDGIVLGRDYLPKASDEAEAADVVERGAALAHGGALVHEFGHWMGLPHTFGRDTCHLGDQIADTVMTTDQSPEVFDCFQFDCDAGDLYGEKIRVRNPMSYSTCALTLSDNISTDFHAFTNGQRAIMFSHFLTFRRGRNCGAKKIDKRLEGGGDSTHLDQSTVDKAILLADLLLDNCSIAIQDVFDEETIPLSSLILRKYKMAASKTKPNAYLINDLAGLQFKTISSSIAMDTVIPTGINSVSESQRNHTSIGPNQVEPRYCAGPLILVIASAVMLL